MLHKLRSNTILSKTLSSDTIHGIHLLVTEKSLPDCFVDFIIGAALIDEDATFSKERLTKVFKPRFPRLFNQTTYNKKTIHPFDFFFEHLQHNSFYTNNPLIIKLDENRYKFNSIQSSIKFNSPHKHFYSALVNDTLIADYNGNMSNFVRDCAWKTMEQLIDLTKGKAVFNFPIIKTIFGLTKNDVKSYMKKLEVEKIFKYRHIGYLEKKDLELDTNLLGAKKNFRFIRGFIFKFETNERYGVLAKIKFNKIALFTIKVRLEKEQYRFSILNFYSITANLPKLESKRWDFSEQYEGLGFNRMKDSRSQYRLKRYVESVNLGSYKQMNNIYDYLSENFDPSKCMHEAELTFRTGSFNKKKSRKQHFKRVFTALKERFIYQY